MSPVEFKKRPCHPVEFKGQGPYDSINNRKHYFLGTPVQHLAVRPGGKRPPGAGWSLLAAAEALPESTLRHERLEHHLLCH